jgi:leader peptidase (prepilin peptidase)/N-methyltransferase
VDAFADFLSTPLAVAFATVLGAIWGSFFNVVIARLPRGESVVRPPSRCLSCGAQIRAADNIPVLSYLWLRGRCRRCGARISLRYPLVEILTAAVAAAIFWKFAGSDAGEIAAVRLGRFVVYFAFAGALIVLSFIDLDTKRLPDVITIPGTIILYFAAFAAHDVSWKERAIGCVAGYLFVRLVADFYFYVLKREGMGLGDGKLLAMVGAVFGWKALPVVLFGGSVIGTVVSIPILLATRSRRADGLSLRQVQVPFGPFLALGALVYMFWGDKLLGLLLPSGLG